MTGREQLAVLAKPFLPHQIHDAPGGYGTFVAHYVVTQKLLAVVGPHDFDLVQTIIDPNGELSGVVCKMTLTIDGETHSITEAGDVETSNPQLKTNGARLKNAMSDAYKRCAMRFGVALHLWCGTKDNYFLYDYLLAQAGGDFEAMMKAWAGNDS